MFLPRLEDFPDFAAASMGAILGISLGIAAAATVGFVVAYHNRDYLMEAGTPVGITLSAPLVLDAKQVNEAVQQFAKAPPPIVPPPKEIRTRRTAGTPDFPATPYPCPY